jgi:hypothetical protein
LNDPSMNPERRGMNAIRYSNRAWRLLEALHEPFGNETRLGIIQSALDGEREAAIALERSRRCGCQDHPQVEPRNNTEGL